MKQFLIKRKWVVSVGVDGFPVVPIYQEAYLWDCETTNTLPGLKRLPDNGDTWGFFTRDTKEEAEEALKGAFKRWEGAGIEIREKEWTVVGI